MAIIVKLRRSDLDRTGACSEGRKLFKGILKGHNETRAAAGKSSTQILSIEWSLLHQLWLAAAYPDFCRWLRDQRLIPWLDMNGANLYGANLYGAHLYGANLVRANLVRANLVRAHLDGANLYGANLYGANLDGAHLYGANLVRANLVRANLYGANLYGANLYGANLDGAHLYGANLYGVRAGETTIPPAGWTKKQLECKCCWTVVKAEPEAGVSNG